MVGSSIDRPNPLPLIVIGWHRKGIFGRVRFQKLVFYCEVKAKNERVSDIFNFGCYKHGSYSSSLTSDINKYETDGIINIKSHKSEDGKLIDNYYLTKKGKEKTLEFISTHRDEYVDIKSVLNKYGRLSTEELMDLVHREFIDFVEDPSPIKKRGEVLSRLAMECEHRAFNSIRNEDITYSTILVILAELFLRLSEKANTNIVYSSSETKNRYFQKWSRFLDKGNRIFTYLHVNEFKVPKDKLLKIQNYLVSLTIEAEKYKFFPTNEELQSKIPVDSIKKLEEIMVS